MSESEVIVSKHATVYSGADAVELFRVKCIALGLEMYNKTGMLLSRNAKPSDLLSVASEYSGKYYKNTKTGRAEAAADMRARHAALAASLPITHR